MGREITHQMGFSARVGEGAEKPPRTVVELLLDNQPPKIGCCAGWAAAAVYEQEFN